MTKVYPVVTRPRSIFITVPYFIFRLLLVLFIVLPLYLSPPTTYLGHRAYQIFIGLKTGLKSEIRNIYQEYNPTQTIFVYGKKGNDDIILARRFFKDNKLKTEVDCIVIPIETIKKLDLAIKAFTSVEDPNFFEHRGIDFEAIAKAGIMNISRFLDKHRKKRGASTITMQLIQMFILDKSPTYVRKIKELAISEDIDNMLSKWEQLYLYLNHVPQGRNIRGIGSAALRLFSIEPESIGSLDLFQWAMLAGIPKCPGICYPRDNPNATITAEENPTLCYPKQSDPEKIKKAKSCDTRYFTNSADRILFAFNRMLELGRITQEKYNQHLPFRKDLDENKIDEVEYRRQFVAKIKSYLNPYNPPYIHLARHLTLSTLIPKRQQALRSTFENCGKACYIYTWIDVDKQELTEDVLKLGLSDISRRDGRYYEPSVDKPDIHLSMKELVPGKIYKAQLTEFSYKIIKQSKKRSKKVPTLRAKLGETDIEVDISWVKRWGKNGKKTYHQVLSPGDTILISYNLKDNKEYFLLEKIPGKYHKGKFNRLEGAIVVIENKTGKVVSLAGGYDFDQSGVNHAINDLGRQPGSSLKPLIAAALMSKKGLLPSSTIPNTPDHYLTDCHELFLTNEEYVRYRTEKITNPYKPAICFEKRKERKLPRRYSLCIDHELSHQISVGDETGKTWLIYICNPDKTYTPASHHNETEVTIRKMVSASINRAAIGATCSLGDRVEVVEEINDEFGFIKKSPLFIHCAHSVEIYRNILQLWDININPEAGLSAALGSFEITPMDQAKIFYTLARNGSYTEPQITYNPDNDNTSSTPQILIPPSEAYLAHSCMEAVIDEGTARRATSLKKNYGFTSLAGKTGTTNGSKDAWFSGYTPEYTIIVWVGYDTPLEIGKGHWGEGSRVALPIWIELLIAFKEAEYVDPEKNWDFKVPFKEKLATHYNEYGELQLSKQLVLSGRGSIPNLPMQKFKKTTPPVVKELLPEPLPLPESEIAPEAHPPIPRPHSPHQYNHQREYFREIPPPPPSSNPFFN